MRSRKKLAALVFIALLNGCALNEHMRQHAATSEIVQHSLTAQHNMFAAVVTNNEMRRKAQSVNKPWIAGKPHPLSREVTLPIALHSNVETTLLFDDGPLNLTEIAERITAVTDIPVKVSPEALLPSADFLPRLTNYSVVNSSPEQSTVYLSGKPEPLVQILDRLAASLSVSWEYKNSRIEFFRTRTKVFNIQALTLESRSEASLGQRSNNNDDGSFASASQTRLESGNENIFDVIRDRIEPFMTRAGVLVAQPGASASIVVTDTPDVLSNIATYIEQENRTLAQRIRLVFEEITLATNNSDKGGFDWDIIFTSTKAAAQAAMGGSGLAEAGMVAAQALTGAYKGSEAIVAALSEAGTVIRRSSVPVLTLNRRPVTHAVRTTFSYIDRVDTTSTQHDSSGLALPSVSVSQKEETVGSLLTLVPDAQSDGRILLSLAYDNTVAQPLKSVRFGDRNNPLQLQQVTIDGNGTVQQLVLQPGQPLLISGFDSTSKESNRRRLIDGLPILFGGSDKSEREHFITVIIITAQIEEGF